MPQHALVNLSRLAKIPSSYTSIKFCLTTPGSADWLCISRKTRSTLDPSHPATRLPLSQFPHVQKPIVGIRAIPMAILHTPLNVDQGPFARSILPWKERIETWANHAHSTPHPPPSFSPVSHHRINMSAQFWITCKPLPKPTKTLKVTAMKCVKTALNLIVTRDMDTEVNEKGMLSLVPNKGTPRPATKWILPGWTYHIRLSPETIIAPLPEMVRTVRDALVRIWASGQKMEDEWSAKARFQTTSVSTAKRDRHAVKKSSQPISGFSSDVASGSDVETQVRISRLLQSAEQQSTTTHMEERPDVESLYPAGSRWSAPPANSRPGGGRTSQEPLKFSEKQHQRIAPSRKRPGSTHYAEPTKATSSSPSNMTSPKSAKQSPNSRPQLFTQTPVILDPVQRRSKP